MKSSEIKVCILRIEGTNCEEEMYFAFKRLGARPEFLHLKELLRTKNLSTYQCLMLPGGFSTGDYVRAGAIFASLLKSNLRKELVRFVDAGYPIGGICNGFQILVELGLLPGLETTMSDVPEAALGINASSRFECRATFLKHESRGKCVFTKNLAKGKIVMFPSAHAEGNFLVPKEKEKRILNKLIETDQIVFRYVDERGNYASYPWNPNGSLYNIAGICNNYGNVFGLMPHPERVFYRRQHPDWTRNYFSEKGDGRIIFESVLEYIEKKF